MSETISLNTTKTTSRYSMPTLGQSLTEVRTLGLLVMLALLTVLFSILSPYFLTLQNLFNITTSVAVIGIAAVGLTFGIIAESVDLSIGSTIALAGVVTAGLVASGLPWWMAVPIGILVGVVIGITNGLAVTRIGVNPIIATIAMLPIVRGLAFVYTGGWGIDIKDPGLVFLGRGYVLGIPFHLIIMLALYVGAYFILTQTAFGRHIYSTGGNPTASWLAGIDVNLYKVVAFVICAGSAALSGVILSAKMGAALPEMAASYEMDVFTAVLLGGASLKGGAGTIQGTLLGVLLIGTVNNGLVLLNVPVYYQMIARGAFLLFAVTVDQLRSRRYE
ncbi:MAG: ABC transporter permease [Chloroflexota bacterium]|nr:MAG: ABC transporter permease [Chloroflexota bacterium]